MPHSELHKKKLQKNLVIGALILLWCVLIWAVTMVKVANAADTPDYAALLYDKDRLAHRVKLDEVQQGWARDYHTKQPKRHAAFEENEKRRINHQERIRAAQVSWTQDWMDAAPVRAKNEAARDAGRFTHQTAIAQKPPVWWQEWRTHQDERVSRKDSQ